MPVLDHEVNEKTRIKAGFKYGCYDRKILKNGYIAFDRQYRPDGTFVIVQKFIENKMSDKCRNFYLWDKDKFCEGCDTQKDLEYAKTMSAL